MARVLLVAATTGYQVRSYGEAATRCGVELLLGTDRCHVLDDPWRDGAVPVRFDDLTHSIQAVTEATAERPIDGVTAVGDRPAIVAAAIARAQGLRGHPLGAVLAAGNKLSTRERLRASGLLVPWFQSFGLDVSVADMLNRGIEFPCVIKPLAMAASRGVMRADTADELEVAHRRLVELLTRHDVRALRDASNEQLLVEGFIPGDEVAVEGIVTDGQLRTLAVFDNPDPLDGPFFEETIYATPSRSSDTRQLHEAVQGAVKSLGLTDGPIHAECRLNDAGVHVLEVAARPIGGLCARVLRFVGPDNGTCSLEELVLRHALGQSVDAYERDTAAAGVMMIPVPADGRFAGVDGLEAARGVAHIEELIITAKPGQHIQPPPEGDSYLGFIFARAEGAEQVVSALRAACSPVRFEIEPILPVV